MICRYLRRRNFSHLLIFSKITLPLLMFASLSCILEHRPVWQHFHILIWRLLLRLNKKNFSIEVVFYTVINSYLKGSSWSWSYGSWIYNYLSIQCLSLHGEVYSIQHYVMKFVSDLPQDGGGGGGGHTGFLHQLFWFPPPIILVSSTNYSGCLHQLIWLPRYNCNIDENVLNTLTSLLRE